MQVQLQSLKLQISRLLRPRSSLTFRQLWSVDSLWSAYVTWQEHTVTPKQIVVKLLTNCLCVFDHFLGLALKGLSKFKQVHPFLIENIYPFLVNVPHFLTPWKHQKIFSFLIFSGSIENGGNGNIGQKWVNVNILLVSIYKLIHKFVHRQINKLINKWMNNKIHK